MLETEEVDVDYFTPSASTTLSKIFGSNSKEEDLIDSNSLKYNPPLPPQVITKTEERKQTQYLFAGTVFAYEWVNNSYEFKGRLGFAILKFISIGIHKMVIYDSNKITLSTLTITQDIEIKVNENISISYYDSLRKFWSVNPSTSNLKEILEILKSLKINLVIVPIADTEDGSQTAGNVIGTVTPAFKLNENEKESDTDASINRKTKNSILKRMATMGQSVLPPTHIPAGQTSDSSDTNESHNQQKPKHKPKSAHKKNITDKKTFEIDKMSDVIVRNISPKPDVSYDTLKDSLNMNDNQNIVPTRTTNIISLPSSHSPDASSNVGLFLTEQRVSHSELRINMNRMTDKLDTLLDKVKVLENVDSNISINRNNESQFQNEIIQKLLNEYEKKIKKYEHFIKSKGFDCDTLELTTESKSNSKCTLCSKVFNVGETEHLEELCNKKDKEMLQLQDKLQILSNKVAQSQIHESSLLKEISVLKTHHENQIDNVSKMFDTTSSDRQSNEIPNKLKQVMNDTFQAISANFDDDERYTGSKIKSIVGLVIKKTTIDSLKEF